MNLAATIKMIYTNVMGIVTSSTFWTALAALFTGALFVVAWCQLNKINKTTSANPLIDFKNNFLLPVTVSCLL
jgi:hypothetical protein